MIGFMQGRLCDPIDGKIQAFPWRDWEQELTTAGRHGFGLMEWTLDLERLHENPLLTRAGRARIQAACAATGVRVGSLTGDNFMHAPFFKATGDERARRLADLDAVLAASAETGIRIVVFPLVDAGRLEDEAQAADLVATCLGLAPRLEALGVQLVFESDFGPSELAGLIAKLPAPWFGINYDTGNSASLGYDPDAELAAYGERVLNVHVKDRKRGGTTVPLGEGALDLPRVMAALRRAGYDGPMILQTARAADGDHLGALARYRELTDAAWRRSDGPGA